MTEAQFEIGPKVKLNELTASMAKGHRENIYTRAELRYGPLRFLHRQTAVASERAEGRVRQEEN